MYGMEGKIQKKKKNTCFQYTGCRWQLKQAWCCFLSSLLIVIDQIFHLCCPFLIAAVYISMNNLSFLWLLTHTTTIFVSISASHLESLWLANARIWPDYMNLHWNSSLSCQMAIDPENFFFFNFYLL